MQVLAKRTVNAPSERDAITIAKASLSDEQNRMMNVKCQTLPCREGNSYRCFVSYKSKRELVA